MERLSLGGRESSISKRDRKVHKIVASAQEQDHEEIVANNPEAIAMIHAAFVSLDKRAIKDVLVQELERSGVPLSRANFAALESFLASPTGDFAAQYDSLTNKILVATGTDFFDKGSIQKFGESGQIDRWQSLYLQKLLIHEFCHALSYVRVTSKDINNAQIETSNESGYSVELTRDRVPSRPEKNPSSKRTLKVLEAFNEGVTERIADEVFMEYMRRIGKSEDGRDFLSIVVKNEVDAGSEYYRFGNQVEHICDRIAQYVGLPKDDVWRAIKRGYFAQPEMYEEETIELLAETFGEDFLLELGRLHANSSATDIGDFDTEYLVPFPRTYTAKWLAHLGAGEEKINPSLHS